MFKGKDKNGQIKEMGGGYGSSKPFQNKWEKSQDYEDKVNGKQKKKKRQKGL